MAHAPTPRIALLADYLEEGWPSMDLVADMTFRDVLASQWPSRLELVRPKMRRRFSAGSARAGRGFTADRAIARYWDLPRLVRGRRDEFDLFHVLDHSYAHLALSLPPGRVVAHCHDVDALRAALEPERERRSLPYRMLSRRLIAGLGRAARVLCISGATRDALVAHGVVAPDRAEVAYLGVHQSCTPEPHAHADAAVVGLLGPVRRDSPELIHVGSTIPRKRIDVLLRAFAVVRGTWPGARLVRAGGDLTPEQAALAGRLGVADAIVSLPFVTREVLAAMYRRAALALQTSDAEGFGLPVAESMACGTPVLASELAVLREIGGDVAEYAPAGDGAAFGAMAVRLLLEREREPEAWRRRRERGMAQAARFTWHAHGERVLDAYRRTWEEVRGGAVAR